MEQTTLNTQPGVNEKPSPEKTDPIAALIGSVIVLGPLFYYYVWKNLPWRPLTKWLLVTGIILVITLVYIFFKARTAQLFEILRRTIVVLLIVFGAVIATLLLNPASQNQLFKVLTIVYFSFLPPWLYLQFIATKGKTLWDEYVLNLFRLEADDYVSLPEPPLDSTFHQTWQDARSKRPELIGFRELSIYEKKFEALFGPVRKGNGLGATFAVFRGENLLPVAITTLLVSVGWVLVVMPQSLFNKSFLPSEFQPSPNSQIPLGPFQFAFLGAYFYILQMLVRRYFQNDLKTNAYVHATMRVIVVILLVWALDLLLKGRSVEQRSAMAFVIGVFPQLGMQALLALVKWPIKFIVPSLSPQYPLSDLDGLSIWYESRLLEEGIEDMQNLVTANLVDVMLNTRIPVGRLVDWIDQSSLYLHLEKDKTDKEGTDRENLRRFGIRAATDLDDLCENTDKELIQKVERLLNKGGEEATVLRTIHTTLKGEPNLSHVRKWKTFAAAYSQSR